MKPLIVLLAVFAVSVFIIRIATHTFDIALAARIAMSAMLVFTSVAHFAFSKGMTMMVPAFIPYKTTMVQLTGIIEIAAAIGLLVPGIKEMTACLLIVFFVLILPANINATMQKVDYQKGTNNGNGPAYLWFRIPLQIFFIAWVYISSIRY